MREPYPACSCICAAIVSQFSDCWYYFVPLGCGLVYNSIEPAFPRILFQFASSKLSRHCASRLACRSLWSSGLCSPIDLSWPIDKTTSWTNNMQHNISWWAPIEQTAGIFARKAVTAHGTPNYIVQFKCGAIFSLVIAVLQGLTEKHINRNRMRSSLFGAFQCPRNEITRMQKQCHCLTQERQLKQCFPCYW